MTWGGLGRRKERIAGVFLLAMTLINVVGVFPLVPLLRQGYQDFTIFYGAAQMVRGGHVAWLYDLPTQYRMQHQFAPNVAIRQAALPYNHPPFEALLFVPFTYLSYLPAYLLWSFLNLIMLALSLRIIRKTFAEVGGLSLVFVILAASGFAPVVNGVVQGQDSVLLLLLMTLSLVSLEEGHDVVAGAVLGAGLFKFHFVLPLLLILLVRRPRLLVGFSPVAAVLASVSVMMVGWKGIIYYVQFLFRVEENGAGGAIIAAMPNLRGLTAGLLGGSGGGRFAILLTVACSIAVMGTALWQVRRRDLPIRCVFAVASVTAIMVSYHALTHDVTWLLPVVLLLFAAPGNATQGEMQVDTILLIAVYTMFLGSSLWPWLNSLWFVPVVIWIYRKYGRGSPAEIVA